ncbi:MAG: BtpA/SgcQ family protein [Candidatus Cloacimonadota bacterium]|nr:BtpA/SgcQ family protein [Candidatus Cloacimonadota bacterium]
MELFKKIFKKQKSVIGMIHVHALPGTPKNSKSISEIIKIALAEVEIYQNNGIDGILLENMHDVPYLNRNVGPEITAAMAVIALRVKQITNLPCGIQILAGANREAVAVAKAANLDFIRAEGFVFSHIADEGFMDGCAGDLIRYRKKIGAENIAIFTDIKKKHSSHAITSDVDLAEMAIAAEFSLSDGIIVTGRSTSLPASVGDLKQVTSAMHRSYFSHLPIIIGSGITDENIEKYWELADCFIVGSYFKKDGFWENAVSEKRVKQFAESIQRLREK